MSDKIINECFVQFGMTQCFVMYNLRISELREENDYSSMRRHSIKENINCSVLRTVILHTEIGN